MLLLLWNMKTFRRNRILVINSFSKDIQTVYTDKVNRTKSQEFLFIFTGTREYLKLTVHYSSLVQRSDFCHTVDSKPVVSKHLSETRLALFTRPLWSNWKGCPIFQGYFMSAFPRHVVGEDHLQRKRLATLCWHPHVFWNGTSVWILKTEAITVKVSKPMGSSLAWPCSILQSRAAEALTFREGFSARCPVSIHNQRLLGWMASSLKRPPKLVAHGACSTIKF